MKYNKEAAWYPIYEAEILRFTGVGDAVTDDQFDSTALLVKGFDNTAFVEPEDFDTEEDWAFRKADPRVSAGRNSVTGY